MGFGDSGGHAPGGPDYAGPMVAVPVQNDIFQNYQKGGFAGSEKLIGAQMRAGDSSQIFSKTGEDITPIYAKYMEWQQQQRVTEHARMDNVAQAQENPGRKQTILVAPTDKKQNTLGGGTGAVFG